MPVLQIVIASTRPGRVGLPVGRWFADVAREHAGFEVELVDLAEVGLPLLDEPNHPRLARYEHQHTKDWSATVSRADAFVFVMPEYNHGFNAALKNAIDFLFHEWAYKPVGFVSYGGIAAGTRAVQLLKPVLASLKLSPAVSAVNIPFVAQFVDDEGRFAPNEQITGGAGPLLDELLSLHDALRGLRERA